MSLGQVALGGPEGSEILPQLVSFSVLRRPNSCCHQSLPISRKDAFLHQGGEQVMVLSDHSRPAGDL